MTVTSSGGRRAWAPVERQLRGNLRRAREFLLARMRHDCLWSDFKALAGESTDWVSGYIASTVGAVSGTASALISHQHADGGWGYAPHVPSDVNSTAQVLLYLSTVDKTWVAGAQRAATLGTEFLLDAQAGCGGFPPYADELAIRAFLSLPQGISLEGWCRPELLVTATAGRALAASGAAHAARARRAWDWVAAAQSPEGGWRSQWWLGESFPMQQAVALGGAVGDRAASRAVLERARRYIEATQNADGGWGPEPGQNSQPFATAANVEALLRLGGSVRRVAWGVEFLSERQACDGGWASGSLLRIPPTWMLETPRRIGATGASPRAGVVLCDQHRNVSTASCVAALSAAAREP